MLQYRLFFQAALPTAQLHDTQIKNCDRNKNNDQSGFHE
jgi:hypothetical protein